MYTAFKNSFIIFLLLWTSIGFAQRQPDPNVGSTSLRRMGGNEWKSRPYGIYKLGGDCTLA